MNVKERAIFFRKDLIDKNIDYQVVYIGNEFCCRLLPDKKTLLFALNWCRKKNCKLVLVLSFFMDQHVKPIEELLELICSENPTSEVVINDWGMVNMLKNRYSNVKVLLGRLITSKYSRYGKYPNAFFNFIKDTNIIGLEFNTINDLLLNYSQIIQNRLHCSVYIPYSYVTISRYCFWQNSFEGYFRNGISGCDRKCKESVAVLKRIGRQKIFIKGNAYFVREKKWDLTDKINVDRVVDNEAVVTTG
ncbi:MAG: hypothetical protein KKH94_04385 [Candidatus Omnitrophica bacterium]|nr:hypothetical protein [Candidatus Omnitrophota bacterium]